MDTGRWVFKMRGDGAWKMKKKFENMFRTLTRLTYTYLTLLNVLQKDKKNEKLRIIIEVSYQHDSGVSSLKASC